MNIVIVGNGKFGNCLFSRLNNATMWNQKDLITNSLVIIAVSIKDFENAYESVYHKSNKFIIATKGITQNGKYPSEILNSDSQYAIFGGPNLYKEINAGEKTYSLLETNYNFDIELKKWLIIQKKKNGLEIVNTLKNIIAILCGFISTRGNNMSAIVMNVGIIEIKRILKLENCEFDDLYMSDIICTASSTSSRNYQYGIHLAKNIEYEETIEGKNSLIGLTKRYKNSILFDLMHLVPDFERFIDTCFSYLKRSTK